MRVSKTLDYALRAMLELTATDGTSLKADQIASAQHIPLNSLENILMDLKRADLITAQRGTGGGYQLARPPVLISLADVVRAIDGPLVTIQGLRPTAIAYEPNTTILREVWIAIEVTLRAVLETVTLADVDRGTLPDEVEALLTSQQLREMPP